MNSALKTLRLGVVACLVLGVLALVAWNRSLPPPPPEPGQTQAAIGGTSPLLVLAIPAAVIIVALITITINPRARQRAGDFEYRKVPVSTPDEVLDLLNTLYGGLVPDARVQFIVDVDASRWMGHELRNADELRRRRDHDQITIKRLIVPGEEE